MTMGEREDQSMRSKRKNKEDTREDKKIERLRGKVHTPIIFIVQRNLG